MSPKKKLDWSTPGSTEFAKFEKKFSADLRQRAERMTRDRNSQVVTESDIREAYKGMQVSAAVPAWRKIVGVALGTLVFISGIMAAGGSFGRLADVALGQIAWIIIAALCMIMIEFFGHRK